MAVTVPFSVAGCNGISGGTERIQRVLLPRALRLGRGAGVSPAWDGLTPYPAVNAKSPRCKDAKGKAFFQSVLGARSSAMPENRSGVLRGHGVLRLDAAFPFEWLRTLACRETFHRQRMIKRESGIKPPHHRRCARFTGHSPALSFRLRGAAPWRLRLGVNPSAVSRVNSYLISAGDGRTGRARRYRVSEAFARCW